MEYRIRAKTLEGRILTYHHVKEYTAKEGLISFIDNKTKKTRIYPASSVEIEPEYEGGSNEY